MINTYLYTIGFLLIISCSAFGQNYRDTLYVIAFNGVNLRAQPNVSSEKIEAIPFGTPVVFCDESFNDQFEVRKGNWIVVEYRQETSFVFDGFLTDKKPPASRDLTLKQLGAYITETYGGKLLNESNKSTENGREVALMTSHYSSGLTLEHRAYSNFESWMYTFPNLRTRDLINLIDLAYSNHNTEGKTLVSFFKEDDFWKNKDPNELCARAFNIELSDTVRIHYDYNGGSSSITITEILLEPRKE